MAEHSPVSLSWASISAAGMRESNQDAIGEAVQGGVACFVVADGAGGHAGGEVASRIAVESVIAGFVDDPAFRPQALPALVERARSDIARDKLQAPARSDMSTTLAALLVDRETGRAMWAHLGDTRIYLFRGGRLHAVTRDHSLTQQLIDSGYASAGQLRTHPQRNVLYAALGADGDTAAAVSGQEPVRAGDAFLLCTDGLWEWVLEGDMERSLQTAPGPEQWLTAMCRIADAGANASRKVRDNYSAYAVLVREAAP